MSAPKLARLFQSTLPRGERRQQVNDFCRDKLFQSTLPRGERPAGFYPGSPEPAISIHAPARGATGELPLLLLLVGISIHAPARGATRAPCAHTALCNISIHAPARGATQCGRACLNNRPFQSTLPRGERRGVPGLGQRDHSISIHAPARGATVSFAMQLANYRISIHAPARGATICGPHSPHDLRISIHAPARGATRGAGVCP